MLISVFTYPNMEPVAQVPAIPNLRILSSTPSPNFSSLCVATNDETVRFYELWPTELGMLAKTQNGLYGSDLIELSEGVDKERGVIR